MPSTPSKFDAACESIIAIRIPREEIALGHAYVVFARNASVGVAVEKDGKLGYEIAREKFGRRFLFTELDWENDPQFGTAIPIRLLRGTPPARDDERLAWLWARHEDHEAETQALWDEVTVRMREFVPRPPDND